MLRLASDADVRGAIIRGLFHREPLIDLVRVQDALPEGTPDQEVLIWAAAQNRILITNDRNTMIGFAYERLGTEEQMPGVIVTTKRQSVRATISDILLIAEYLSEEEIRDRILFLPYRE